MAVKIQTIEQSFENNGLKILVHGPAGIGKTVLCATTGKKTLIINCEAGLLSLKNAARNGIVSQENMDKIRTVQIKNIQQMREIHDMLVRKEFECEWVCLDSISEIAEVVLSEAKKEDKDPRASYGKLIDAMTRLIKDFRDLPHYNVLMTCKQERFTDQLTSITTYVPSMPGAKLGPSIPYLFDEVWAMMKTNIEVDDGKYEERRALQTNRSVQYEAKDRSGVLNMYEPPNIEHIYGKIHPTMESEPLEAPEEVVEEGPAESTETEEAQRQKEVEEFQEQLAKSKEQHSAA